MNRQEKWKKLDYTDEQIENHLRMERYKAKQAREKRQLNNIKNQEIIKQIKRDLIDKTFIDNRCSNKILSISPTVDGVGFWFKVQKIFSDNSSGNFRYFERFSGYSKKQFIKDLK